MMNDLRPPKAVAKYRQPLEAEMLANKLRERGIEVLTTGTAIATAGIDFAQVDVAVIVPAVQFDAARTIAAENATPIDWTNVDLGAPESAAFRDVDNLESDIARMVPRSSSVGNWIVGWLLLDLIFAVLIFRIGTS